MLHVEKRRIQAAVNGQIKVLFAVIHQQNAGLGCLCIVDQHVDPSKGLSSLGNDASHLFFHAAVRLAGQRLNAI